MRWYRLSEDQRAAIENPGAWLTRVAGRVCLDMLGSARARRERYVGEWLPEPLPATSAFAASAADDPLERMTLDDSVSTALLVVLESLTPAERVAFVLHDVFAMPFAEVAETVGRSPDACRQLASQARRHIRERRAGAASREAHDALAQAFAVACARGDLVGAHRRARPGGRFCTATAGGSSRRRGGRCSAPTASRGSCSGSRVSPRCPGLADGDARRARLLRDNGRCRAQRDHAGRARGSDLRRVDHAQPREAHALGLTRLPARDPLACHDTPKTLAECDRGTWF